MLGVCLLFVGIVLINNGIGRLKNIDGKSLSVMNFFTGGLSLVINIINLIQGDYLGAGTGLLFCFTYLFVAINSVFGLDGTLFAWFSTFVAGTSFVEVICKKPLGKFTPYLQVFEGIVTAWIPGVMMMTGVW